MKKPLLLLSLYCCAIGGLQQPGSSKASSHAKKTSKPKKPSNQSFEYNPHVSPDEKFRESERLKLQAYYPGNEQLRDACLRAAAQYETAAAQELAPAFLARQACKAYEQASIGKITEQEIDSLIEQVNASQAVPDLKESTLNLLEKARKRLQI